jgi:hypothetical protein
MKKAFLWFVFIAHTLCLSVYLGLVVLGHIKSEKLILIILSISGILTTLTFSEYVLKEEFKHRIRK